MTVRSAGVGGDALCELLAGALLVARQVLRAEPAVARPLATAEAPDDYLLALLGCLQAARGVDLVVGRELAPPSGSTKEAPWPNHLAR
ncbi:MAG TPA: hypothetical protein VFA20_17020 [Myxococcaceae bacterium]|nr:hypothetical protein [Myxococcaceae bacterium]